MARHILVVEVDDEQVKTLTKAVLTSTPWDGSLNVVGISHFDHDEYLNRLRENSIIAVKQAVQSLADEAKAAIDNVFGS